MPKKILIVDDDLDTVRLVGLMLERQGYDIIAASSGDQVPLLAEREQPDLIVLDIMMPDMDGYQVTRLLRENPFTTNIPILMFTAKDQVDDKLLGLDLGADDYVTKPTQPRELIAHVEAILARASKIPVPASRKIGEAVIAVMSAKGGLGVTTLALNLAIALRSLTKKEVVLAEFRPGQSTLSIELGYENQEGLNRLLAGKHTEISNREIENELISHNSGIRLLLSSYQAHDAAHLSAIQAFETITHLLSQRPGYLVIDLGPALTTAVGKVLKYCDQMLVVVEPSPQSAVQTRTLIQDLIQHGFRASQIKLVLINRLRSSIQLSSTQVQERVAHSIATVFTPAPELTYQASLSRTPILIHRPESLTAGQFRELAGKLVQASVLLAE